MRELIVDVRGMPRPQGSVRPIVRKDGKVITKYADTVWDWRNTVQVAVREAMEQQGGDWPMRGPVELHVGFELPRNASDFLPINSRRRTPEVRPTAPAWPAKAPDLDKLIRAICDACTDAGLWGDDGQVVTIMAGKRYGENPGVRIAAHELDPPPQKRTHVRPDNQQELPLT
jgi:crossover junction endodeoxyribonuclease RusA